MSEHDHADGLAHPRVPMTGRDPEEGGRVASPLELLFDLTFVVAVGTAASYFAETIAEGHVLPAIGAFVLAMFAIGIAWISFSWFASAFDTDDWLYRALTMLQMVGVVVFALGLPAMFTGLAEGDHLEVRVMVLGYVVMRVAMVLQWWRAARESPEYRSVAFANIRWTIIAQVGWVVIAFLELPIGAGLAAFTAFGLLELALPVFAQDRANGTPWHPHHMAERYSLFAIITLGEGVVGTIASSSGLLGGGSGMNWSSDAIAVVVAGVGLTFGMWWVYFAVPFGEILDRRRGHGYLFGYGHVLVFAGIAGAGAGLHLTGLQLEHHSTVGNGTVVLALAVPVGLYLLMVYLLHEVLLAQVDRLHLLLIAITLAVLAAAVLLAAAGVGISVCLLVVMLAPWVTVVAYETIGHRHQRSALDGLRQR